VLARDDRSECSGHLAEHSKREARPPIVTGRGGGGPPSITECLLRYRLSCHQLDMVGVPRF
jgi:hypothetical protein